MATVEQLRVDPETGTRSALNEEIYDLVREGEFPGGDDIAHHLLREGPQFFLRLTPEDQYRLVYTYVQKVTSVERRHGGQHRRVLIYRRRGWHVVPLSAWRKP